MEHLRGDEARAVTCGKPQQESAEVLAREGPKNSWPLSSSILRSSIQGWFDGNAVRVL